MENVTLLWHGGNGRKQRCGSNCKHCNTQAHGVVLGVFHPSDVSLCIEYNDGL